MPDDRTWNDLVSGVLRDDMRAWQLLQTRMLRKLETWTRAHRGMRSRRLSSSDDDVREVMVATLERLRANDSANLRRFVTLHTEADDDAFERWLYGCLGFVISEHLRTRYGRAPRPAATHEEPRHGPSRRELNTLAPRFDEQNGEGIGMEGGLTCRLTLREIMEHVRQYFTADEAVAMQLYVEQGATYEEVARTLGLDSPEIAERLIRKLKERLRVAFREK